MRKNANVPLAPKAGYALWAEAYPPWAHNPVMLAEERAMLSLMPREIAAGRVVDIGCGSGRYIRHALDAGAATVVGVDFSEPMLRQAERSARGYSWRDEAAAGVALACGSLTAVPIRSAWADVSICALAVGHVEDLAQPLGELARITKPGGCILCSDFHPLGAGLGWTRDFKAGATKYAVYYATHTIDKWHRQCDELGLIVDTVVEEFLDPRDIPAGCRFDVAALEVPVVLVLALRRPPL